MSARKKNQSKYPNTAFLLVDIQIWIDLKRAKITRKGNFGQGNALVQINKKLKKVKIML